MTRIASPFVVFAFGLAACANPQDQLLRAEHHYQNARYEAALTNLEDLEIHVAGLSRRERIRYEVARGMTHLRLEQPDDARHWLAVAREEAAAEPDALSESARTTVERTIGELDPMGPRARTTSSGGEAAAAVP